ncbi:MAG: FMN-binding protein [Spirochaetaceae bacterium]|jgi:Na+-transporting NADH:ubiquinone oxidoreductase subunit C|nr:FMN-binding protein [Spirochaetaceae bacterium]
MKKDGFLYTVIFSFIVAFVFVFFLSLANQITKPIVEATQKAGFYTSVLNAAGIDPGNDVKATFDAAFPGEDPDVVDLFTTQWNGQSILVRRFSGPGLWGTITGVLAVNGQVDQIIGLEIISHSETPGLGGRIEEDWFKNQFRGENIPSGRIVVKKGTGEVDNNPNNQQVDGITGASLTSKSMETIINDTIQRIKLEAGGN